MATGERRVGYASVTPRIVVHDVETLVQFLRRVFDAEGLIESGRPVELQIVTRG